MPSKRCLVKSCKHPAKRIFKIPNADVAGYNVWTLWMNVVDPDRRNIGGPYGICSSHFSDSAFIPASENKDKYGHLLRSLNLKPSATPTLFLDDLDDEEETNENTISIQESSEVFPINKPLESSNEFTSDHENDIIVKEELNTNVENYPDEETNSNHEPESNTLN
jgi:hypothetical protein